MRLNLIMTIICKEMYKTVIHDSQGFTLHPGDKVHNKWGYDLIVSLDENCDWYGKLICEPGDSCENIPYALVEQDITLI